MHEHPAPSPAVTAVPRLTVFGVVSCEDTAITRDRLRARRVRFTDVDLDADPGADSRVRALNGGRRVTPTVVLGDPETAETAEAEPDLPTVDRLADAADPDALPRPTLERLHGEVVTRAIPYAALPEVAAAGAAEAPGRIPFSLAAERSRRQVALFLAHDGACLACLGYAKQLAAARDALAEASAVAVVVGRGDPAQLAAWREHLPAGTRFLADPDGRWRAAVLERVTGGAGEAGAHATDDHVADDGVALVLLDRYGAPRAFLAASDAGGLDTPSEAVAWLAYLEMECGACSTDLPGWSRVP